MHFKIFAHASENSTILVMRFLRQNASDSLRQHLLFYSTLQLSMLEVDLWVAVAGVEAVGAAGHGLVHPMLRVAQHLHKVQFISKIILTQMDNII